MPTNALAASRIRLTSNGRWFQVDHSGTLARSAGTRLANPASVLAWNSDKRYLATLAGRGVATPPTTWTDGVTASGIQEAFAASGADQLIVKPTVSGGAWKTLRLQRGQPLDDVLRDAPQGNAMLQPYVEQFPVVEHDFYLALWHGFTPALGLSALIVAGGILLHRFRSQVADLQRALPSLPPGELLYRRVVNVLDLAAVWITGRTQRGSLMFYLSVILITAIVVPLVALIAEETPPLGALRVSDGPGQLIAGAAMVVAALLVPLARKRFLAVLLVSVTGYGLALIFALQGAPDLALTQTLVETVLLVAFVLALRSLPAPLWHRNPAGRRLLRGTIAVTFGLFMMALAAFSISSRTADPISLELPRMAYELGDGQNVVNVILVDFRGFDTLGETTVLALSAMVAWSLLGPRTDARQDRWRLARRRVPRGTQGDDRLRVQAQRLDRGEHRAQVPAVVAAGHRQRRGVHHLKVAAVQGEQCLGHGHQQRPGRQHHPGADPLAQPARERPGEHPGQRARTGLVRSVKEKKARRRVRRLQRPLDLRLAGLQRASPVRAMYKATRETIWSAISCERRSRAVCSAATVAYSELTTSIPASDPAVASRTTPPPPRSTSR